VLAAPHVDLLCRQQRRTLRALHMGRDPRLAPQGLSGAVRLVAPVPGYDPAVLVVPPGRRLRRVLVLVLRRLLAPAQRVTPTNSTAITPQAVAATAHPLLVMGPAWRTRIENRFEVPNRDADTPTVTTDIGVEWSTE
jgi:hypothetical protein